MLYAVIPSGRIGKSLRNNRNLFTIQLDSLKKNGNKLKEIFSPMILTYNCNINPFFAKLKFNKKKKKKKRMKKKMIKKMIKKIKTKIRQD